MSRFALFVFLVSFLPSLAVAQEAAQLCHEKAARQAGIRDITIGDGRASITLGGSVAVGVSRSSGPATAGAPAYAGSAASERFEEKRRQKIYRRTYDACMSGR
ncbi:hypothetical protein [Ruegeria marina]|uniref:UrcA family protein n=1 Tax=Ruegeria marina TaxID=639004 RepID=A0A1G6JZU5_9RHOB|nr:hypothetical protein [Ruegeria marina]SDC23556.1 hypothetical protein SAMN04488239_101466 [Ruegeria marina]